MRRIVDKIRRPPLVAEAQRQFARRVGRARMRRDPAVVLAFGQCVRARRCGVAARLECADHGEATLPEFLDPSGDTARALIAERTIR